MVTGQVVNKTAGGGSTAGTTVLLVAFRRKEQAPVGQRSAQTDIQGRFSFDGLDRDPNLVYIALARYQNVNYPTDQPFQLQDQATHPADIVVYEATNADDAIQLERLNLLVVGADQGIVQFMEMGSLINNGDRTFVTANPQGQVSGLGSTGAIGPNQLALISLGVVLFVLGGGVLLFGGRLRPSVGGRSVRSAVENDQERLELVVRLAVLDERFAAGELNESEYNAERVRGKQRLRELTLLTRREATV